LQKQVMLPCQYYCSAVLKKKALITPNSTPQVDFIHDY